MTTCRMLMTPLTTASEIDAGYSHKGLLALSLLAQEERDGERAAGFNTQYGQYLGMDFLLLGRQMGLSDELTKKILVDLTQESDVAESTYKDSFMPATAIHATLQCYQQRLMLQIVELPFI